MPRLQSAERASCPLARSLDQSVVDRDHARRATAFAAALPPHPRRAVPSTPPLPLSRCWWARSSRDGAITPATKMLLKTPRRTARDKRRRAERDEIDVLGWIAAEFERGAERAEGGGDDGDGDGERPSPPRRRSEARNRPRTTGATVQVVATVKEAATARRALACPLRSAPSRATCHRTISPPNHYDGASSLARRTEGRADRRAHATTPWPPGDGRGAVRRAERRWRRRRPGRRARRRRRGRRRGRGQQGQGRLYGFLRHVRAGRRARQARPRRGGHGWAAAPSVRHAVRVARRLASTAEEGSDEEDIFFKYARGSQLLPGGEQLCRKPAARRSVSWLGFWHVRRFRRFGGFVQVKPTGGRGGNYSSAADGAFWPEGVAALNYTSCTRAALGLH